MHQALSRRERQIMDVLYRLGRATAADVQTALPGSPSDSTVRTQLRVLEGKGHVVHELQGNRFVYAPTVPRHSARRSALRHLMDTFYDGSRAKVVAALLGADTGKLTAEELEGIEALIRRAREDAS